jgi:hypothetical protein
LTVSVSASPSRSDPAALRWALSSEGRADHGVSGHGVAVTTIGVVAEPVLYCVIGIVMLVEAGTIWP